MIIRINNDLSLFLSHEEMTENNRGVSYSNNSNFVIYFGVKIANATNMSFFHHVYQSFIYVL